MPDRFLNWEWLSQVAAQWSLKLVAALLVFFIGRWLGKRLARLLARAMARANLDALLVKFCRDVVYWVLLVVVSVAALDQLGVNVAALLAVLGAAGLAVGLAMKDSLSNWAAGVMLVLFRPFNLGDYIQAAGVDGTVEEISLFCTVLKAIDGRKIVVPNADLFEGTIINFSANPSRRIELIVGVHYDDNLQTAQQLVADVLAADPRVLPDPAPATLVTELADSNITLSIRAWVAKEDFLQAQSDLRQRIRRAFADGGIRIPYPQREVYLHSDAQ